ncbi:MAG: hypothetical protein OEV72_04895 [Thermoleophilia bacterium]|nr:hypothetical protein [Thermoleophilia bacterium]
MRLPALSQPSIEQRETQSALLARTWSANDGAGAPEWRSRVLRGVRETVKPIEPPLLDGLAALSFRLTGHEGLWVPRLLSALFWVTGASFSTA